MFFRKKLKLYKSINDMPAHYYFESIKDLRYLVIGYHEGMKVNLSIEYLEDLFLDIMEQFAEAVGDQSIKEKRIELVSLIRLKKRAIELENIYYIIDAINDKDMIEHLNKTGIRFDINKKEASLKKLRGEIRVLRNKISLHEDSDVKEDLKNEFYDMLAKLEEHRGGHHIDLKKISTALFCSYIKNIKTCRTEAVK